MSWRLTPLVIGVALVTAGVLLLLRNLGVLPPGVSLWPLLLVAVGGVLLVGGLRQGEEAPTEGAETPLEGAREARVALQHGAGVLEVTGTAAPGVLLSGTFAGGVRQSAERQGDRLDVTLRHPSDPDQLFRQHRGLRWSVALTTEVPIDLELSTGAARAHLDLTQVPVRALRILTGASEVDCSLPSRGRSTARISAGAAEVRLHVPPGVAARVRSHTPLASVTVDQRRFPVWERGYRSAAYETAEDRVDIELEGGVASFHVD